MVMYCVSCGENLAGESSKKVADLWKKLIAEELSTSSSENVESCIAQLIKDHRMCRKCFYSFDRYLRLHKSLKENISDAVTVLCPARMSMIGIRRTTDQSGSSAAKRLPPPPIVASASGSKESPVVSVCCLLLVFIQVKILFVLYYTDR